VAPFTTFALLAQKQADSCDDAFGTFQRLRQPPASGMPSTVVFHLQM
jgi:hypothetical protein